MNGVNGAGGGQGETLQWKIGLVNSEGKYLTAETFGFKINASGASLRKKQVWTIEHDDKDDTVVYIRSHLGRYLAGDKKGNVECNSEDRGDAEKFVIHYASDGSGRWAFQNKMHTYYFGGSEDTLKCYEKAAGATEWWTIRFAVHPQVNLRHSLRQKYAHLHTENSAIQIDELIPWGQDALITLEFNSGKYALKTCDSRYLERSGKLVDAPGPDTLYTIELRSGQHSGMALKDSQGNYMTAVGKDATMQARSKSMGKDQLFTLEDSHPQVFFTAHNAKNVSTKQGIDLTANQEEVGDKETFQVEFDRKVGQWRVRTSDNKYWSLEQASGIQAVGNSTSGTGLFSIECLEDGAVSIKATNGKFVTARPNGSLYAVCDAVSDKERFFMTIVNRPILVLKCDYGFVGFKQPSNPRIECNKSAVETMVLEHSGGRGAAYFFKGANGKYWSVDAQSMINADSDEPVAFILELRGQSRFSIKAPNGCYIKGEQNGIMSATSKDVAKDCLWEY